MRKLLLLIFIIPMLLSCGNDNGTKEANKILVKEKEELIKENEELKRINALYDQYISDDRAALTRFLRAFNSNKYEEIKKTATEYEQRDHTKYKSDIMASINAMVNTKRKEKLESIQKEVAFAQKMEYKILGTNHIPERDFVIWVYSPNELKTDEEIKFFANTFFKKELPSLTDMVIKRTNNKYSEANSYTLFIYNDKSIKAGESIADYAIERIRENVYRDIKNLKYRNK